MFDVDWRTPHLWRKTTPAREPAPALAGDVETDILVVGGGFTGLSAALAARQAGARVMLLEGNEIGSGASGRNNGLVISHHARAAPSEFEQAFGKVMGERFNTLVAGAADNAFALMRELGIDAHQVQNGWIQPAHNAATLARARRFHAEWKALGADVSWLDAADVSARIGSLYRGGWMAHGSGHINPFALTAGLAEAAQARGVGIFENSRASGMARSDGGWRILAGSGSVTAREVILATNALTGNLWPGLRQTLIPIRIFEAATDPVPPELRTRILPGNPAVSDMHNDLRFFHYDRDYRLVSGGTLTFWHDEAARGRALVARRLAATFAALGGEPVISEYWSGVLAAVPDRRPRLYRLAPGVVFGGVYSGRGVALALALGREMGLWAAGQRADGDMPLPVTAMKPVPFHAVAVQAANRIHPWHRLKDWCGT